MKPNKDVSRCMPPIHIKFSKFPNGKPIHSPFEEVLPPALASVLPGFIITGILATWCGSSRCTDLCHTTFSLLCLQIFTIE